MKSTGLNPFSAYVNFYIKYEGMIASLCASLLARSSEHSHALHSHAPIVLNIIAEEINCCGRKYQVGYSKQVKYACINGFGHRSA